MTSILLLTMIPCPNSLGDQLEFSVDPASPESWSPADILESDGSAERYTAMDLGLPADVNVDAFSYGTDEIEPLAPYYFTRVAYSVNRLAQGNGGAITAQANLNGAAGDKFQVWAVGYLGQLFAIQPPSLVSDAPVHRLSPLVNQSDLDGLSLRVFGSSDFPVYFSVPPGHPTWNPGDILIRTDTNTPPAVWANAAQLGLSTSDDIDALAIGTVPVGGSPPPQLGPNVVVWVSLAAGSPARAIAEAQGGDGVIQIHPDPHELVLDANTLGLAPADELNALTGLDPGRGAEEPQLTPSQIGSGPSPVLRSGDTENSRQMGAQGIFPTGGFLSYSLTGDFDVRFSLTKVEVADFNPATSGLALWEGTDAASRFVFGGARGDASLEETVFAYQDGSGSFTENAMPNPVSSYPQFFSMKREEDTVTTYVSADGMNWEAIGAVNSDSWIGGALADTVNVGIFLSSGSGQDALIEFMGPDDVAFGPPKIDRQPEDALVYEGGTATFSVDLAGGYDDMTFQWFKNGEEISGANDRTLSVAGVTDADSGSKFQVFIVNLQTADEVLSQPATLTVPPAARALVAYGLEETLVGLLFSEPISQQTGANPANFTFTPGVGVTDVDFGVNQQVIMLATDMPLQESTTYMITVNGVGEDGNAIDPAHNSVQFVPGDFEGLGATSGSISHRILDGDETIGLFGTAQVNRLTDFQTTLTFSVGAANGAVLGGFPAYSHAVLQVAAQAGLDPSTVPHHALTWNIEFGTSTCCGGAPADGMGLTFGELNTLPRGTLLQAEEPLGSGLSITLDTWDNGPADNAPGINVHWNGLSLGGIATAGRRESGPTPDIPTDPATGQPLEITTGPTPSPFTIVVNSRNELSTFYKDVPVLENAPLAGAPLTAEKLAGFYVGARTGGANQEHALWDHDVKLFKVPGLLRILEEQPDVSVKLGQTIMLAPQVGGNPPMSAQWFRNGEALPGETSLQLHVTGTPAIDGNQYHLQVQGLFNALTSFVTTVSFDPAPFLVAADGQTNPNGVVLQFNEAIDPLTATMPENYLINGLTVTGASVDLMDSRLVHLTTSDQTLGQTYTVSVQNVEDQDGNAITPGPTPVTFTFAEGFVAIAGGFRAPDGTEFTAFGPISFRNEPQGQTVFEGFPASFEVSVDGSPPYSHRWFRDGVEIPGATGPSLTIPVTTAADDGSRFTVRVNNGFSVATSQEAPLTVRLNPTVLECFGTVYDPRRVNVTYNRPVRLDGIYQINGGAIPVASVRHGTSENEVVLTTEQDLVPLTPYTLAISGVTNPGGEPMDPDPIQCEFYHYTTGYSQDFGSGGDVFGTVYGHARLDSGVLKLTDAVGSQGGNYVVSDVTGGEVINGFTAQFDLLIGGGNGADGFGFHFGAGLPDGTIEFAEESQPGAALSVTFDTWDNGGTDQAPAIGVGRFGNMLFEQLMPVETGTQFVPVRIHLEPDGTVDVEFDGVRIFDNVATGYTPVSGGKFVLAARTGGAHNNHWVDNLAINLQLSMVPEITQQPTDLTVIAGADAGFSVEATGPEPLRYQWFKDGQPLTGQTNETLTIAGVSEADAGEYRVEVRSDAGNVFSEVGTLTVLPAAGTILSTSPEYGATDVPKDSSVSFTIVGGPEAFSHLGIRQGGVDLPVTIIDVDGTRQEVTWLNGYKFAPGLLQSFVLVGSLTGGADFVEPLEFTTADYSLPRVNPALPSADLELVVSPEQVSTLQNLPFVLTFEVSNHGPGNAEEVVIRGVPGEFQINAMTGPGTTGLPPDAIELGTIGAGQTVVQTLEVQSTVPAQIHAKEMFVATHMAYDPNLANNGDALVVEFEKQTELAMNIAPDGKLELSFDRPKKSLIRMQQSGSPNGPWADVPLTDPGSGKQLITPAEGQGFYRAIQEPDPTAPPITLPAVVFHKVQAFEDGVPVEGAAWWDADVTYTGGPDELYFNLASDDAEPAPIQNIPLPQFNAREKPVTVTVHISLSHEGEVQFRYTISPDPEVEFPIEPPPIHPDEVPRSFVIEGGVGDDDDWWTNFDDVQWIEIKGPVWREAVAKNIFPNPAQEPLACVPAAIKNSLDYLNSGFGLGINPSLITLQVLKDEVGFIPAYSDLDLMGRPRLRGGTPDGFLELKDQYLQDPNINIPITTRLTFNVEEAINALEKCCDVELWETAHFAPVRAIQARRNAPGLYSLTVADDANQWDDQNGQLRHNIVLITEGSHYRVNDSPQVSVAPRDFVVDAGAAKAFRGFVIECPAGL